MKSKTKNRSVKPETHGERQARLTREGEQSRRAKRIELLKLEVATAQSFAANAIREGNYTAAARQFHKAAQAANLVAANLPR